MTKEQNSGRDPNSGHGWVLARPDGAKAKCGGPTICKECAREKAELEASYRPQAPLTSNQQFSVPYELMNRVYNVLAHYANEVTYEAPRIGGVAQGCPRGERLTPGKLVWSARFMLRELEREVLKRDAWDWIGKYEPVGPHCDTCRCRQDETTTKYLTLLGEYKQSHAVTATDSLALARFVEWLDSGSPEEPGCRLHHPDAKGWCPNCGGPAVKASAEPDDCTDCYSTGDEIGWNPHSEHWCACERGVKAARKHAPEKAPPPQHMPATLSTCMPDCPACAYYRAENGEASR